MSQYDFLWDYFVWYNVVMIFPENTSYLCQCKTCYSLITVATFTIQLCYNQVAKNWQKVGLNNQSTIASILCCWNITFRWWQVSWYRTRKLQYKFMYKPNTESHISYFICCSVFIWLLSHIAVLFLKSSIVC
jgi:predicted signal transduction protein with EAL and GGDEF domain